MNISEIILVLVVALLVIRPEQLPDVAFKLGKWSKRIREGMAKLRHELDGTVNHLSQDITSPKNKINIDNESSY